MPIVELDMLIAFVNPADKLHIYADKLFKAIADGKLRNIRMSTSALLEYELVLRSRGYSEKDIREDLFAFKILVKEIPLTGDVIIKASELREKYGLTYFDSLHAATAIVTDDLLISSDKDYEKVKDLKVIKPEEFLR